MPTLASADVILIPAPGVDIVAVNGVSVESNSFFSDTSRIQLDNGQHQIVAEYVAEIEESADDYLLEKSDTFVLLFNANDTTLNLSAPAVSSQYALQTFNQGNQWQLTRTDGTPVEFTTGKLEKEGFQLGRDYEKELKRFNHTQAKAALPALATDTHSFQSSGASIHSSETGITDQKMAGEMLQFWYERADQNTRDKFKSWIKTSQ